MKGKLLFLCGFFLLLSYAGLARQTVRVAYQNNFYPYAWSDSIGQPRGFLIDWWRLWAQKVKVQVEFVGGTNDECIQMVLADSADALDGMFFEVEMQDRLQFGEYIMRLRSVLFLQKGYKPGSPELIDKPIGIIQNEFSEHLVRSRYPRMALLYFNNFREMRARIQDQTLSGFVYEYPDVRPPYLQIPPPKGYYEFLVLRADKIRPAVREGNTAMMSLLMTGAAQISDEDIVQLVSRYTYLKKASSVPWNGLIVAFTLVVLSAVVLAFLAKARQKRAAAALAEEWRHLLEGGETGTVEFKSSLRWDYRQEKVNKTLEYVIAKTLSAFLNTEGGVLFIGVDDQGKPLGLAKDYDTLSKKNSDGFLLALTDVVNRYLGKELHRYISARILPADGVEICMISAERSDVPVFLETGSGQEFFIRTPAASQPLSMREAMDYINSHWTR